MSAIRAMRDVPAADDGQKNLSYTPEIAEKGWIDSPGVNGRRVRARFAAEQCTEVTVKNEDKTARAARFASLACLRPVAHRAAESSRIGA